MIVLASASSARRALLAAAGIEVAVDPSSLDEGPVKQSLRLSRTDPAVVADRLAWLKAGEVSARHPAALVIGADQMLDLDGEWFDKPVDRAGAAAQLRRLRHRCHRLVSAVVTVRDGVRLWGHVADARLTMRDFSDDFLDRYLDRAGPSVLSSVGAYQLEGLGAQLFQAVDGDFFTILGLPLLPLLDFLRIDGGIPQ